MVVASGRLLDSLDVLTVEERFGIKWSFGHALWHWKQRSVTKEKDFDDLFVIIQNAFSIINCHFEHFLEGYQNAHDKNKVTYRSTFIQKVMDAIYYVMFSWMETYEQLDDVSLLNGPMMDSWVKFQSTTIEKIKEIKESLFKKIVPLFGDVRVYVEQLGVLCDNFLPLCKKYFSRRSCLEKSRLYGSLFYDMQDWEYGMLSLHSYTPSETLHDCSVKGSCITTSKQYKPMTCIPTKLAEFKQVMKTIERIDELFSIMPHKVLLLDFSPECIPLIKKPLEEETPRGGVYEIFILSRRCSSTRCSVGGIPMVKRPTSNYSLLVLFCFETGTGASIPNAGPSIQEWDEDHRRWEGEGTPQCKVTVLKQTWAEAFVDTWSYDKWQRYGESMELRRGGERRLLCDDELYVKYDSDILQGLEPLAWRTCDTFILSSSKWGIWQRFLKSLPGVQPLYRYEWLPKERPSTIWFVPSVCPHYKSMN